MRLTNQSASAIRVPAGKEYLLVFDDELAGFGLKVSAGGSRVWVVQYRNGLGQTKRETLGKAGLLSATEARRAAAERLARVRLGEDPHAARQQARARAAVTVGALVERYLTAMESEMRPRTLAETRRYVRILWKPLHKTPLDGVTRAEVAERLHEIATENGPHAANRARASLSAFFSWVIGQGAAETNPTIGTLKATAEVKRRRVLAGGELAAIWAACDGDDFGVIVRLLALTGQRRDEVAGMRWSELDLVGGIWHLPEERTKNRLPHDVPLARAALDLLAARHRVEGRDHVFGRGEGSFSGFSRAKAGLDQRCGVKDWRLHDLRRTLSTGMNNLGVLPHVVEAVINHISGAAKSGVAGVYNYALYNPEKRLALDLWADHVTTLKPRVQVAASDTVAPRA